VAPDEHLIQSASAYQMPVVAPHLLTIPGLWLVVLPSRNNVSDKLLPSIIQYVKNCSLYTLLTATDQKPQKS